MRVKLINETSRNHICEPVIRILCEDWRLDRAIAADANANRKCNERVAENHEPKQKPKSAIRPGGKKGL